MSDIIDPKEKLLIECCISSIELFIKVIGIIRGEYFDHPLDRVVVFIVEYYKKYKNIPDKDIIFAETGVQLNTRQLNLDDIEYVTDELEKHCRNAAMRLAILSGAKRVNEEGSECDYGSIFEDVRNVLMISVDKDLGLNQFEDVETRHLRMQMNIDSRSIGWSTIDAIIDYVRRGELITFAGGSGSGKSVVLTNVANNMAHQGLNVLYISLELNEDLISKRMDSIITNIPLKGIFDNTNAIQTIYDQKKTEYGSVYTKRMRSGTTANTIRSYLLEYSLQFGYYPDVICLDYLDLLSPIKKEHSKDVFTKDKAVSEELRDIFDEFGIYGFSASQLNRDSIDQAIKSQSQIAGGISKVNTSDAVIAISRTEEQIDNGEIEFQPLKLRNASMKHRSIVLYWDDTTLQITENPNIHCSSLNNSSSPVQSGERTEKPLSNKEKIKQLLDKKKR